MHKTDGFTLVEILVSAVIFTVVIVGLLSVFSSSSRLMTHSRERMIGAEFGRFFIDPLQMSVRQDTWGANDLNVGNTWTVTQKISNRNFTVNYVVAGEVADPALANTDLRRVTTKISWDEPPPA